MAAPVVQLTANAPASPHGFSHATRAKYDDPNDPNAITSGNWDIVEPAPENEPEDFDLAVQPAELNTAHLTGEMAKACIEVRDVPFSEWGIIQNHPPFQRNAEPPVPTDDAGNKNESNLWVLHALSAYEGSDLNDHDPDGGDWHGGDSANFLRVFCETIRDVRSFEQAKGNAPQAYDVILQRILTHEVLHCFLGPHKSLYQTRFRPDPACYTNHGIMDVDTVLFSQIAELTTPQIKAIQSKNNPKPL
jgi:hypothetical protein